LREGWHAGFGEDVDQVDRSHRRVAFLAGQPDDGVEDLIRPGVEQVAQVIVRCAYRTR
jgi:hypothetical protein